MKTYDSLFTQSASQPKDTAFAAFFPPTGQPFDTPFKWLAEKTLDGVQAWEFEQDQFKDKYKKTGFAKLRNYLNYTFMRLQVLNEEDGGGYLITSSDNGYCCFNSGLQDNFGNDLILIFDKFISKDASPHPDWRYHSPCTPNAPTYIDKFGPVAPRLAWYTKDSRDYIFDLSYSLNEELFEHVFVRAKERAGMPPDATDEVVKNYLSGVLKGLIPKIQRNYKVAIPMYYVQEKKMQLLLPFSAVTGKTQSAFLVERDDDRKRYVLKTILDMDHAYFAARLITRPDEHWLKP